MASTGTAVLVEGNPDTLRLHQIGVKTAVAPCGTALTEDQIGLIKSRAANVIIIGDTDEAGKDAMQKNAELCLKAGMSVKVMELPEGKDADEFFRTHSHEYDDCLASCTYDFLPWRCGKRMDGLKSPTDKAEAIREICGLLAVVNNENTAQMYLDLFTKEYKNGKVWTQEYYRARNARERKASKDENADYMLKEYGFYVKGDCYYGAVNASNDRRWSNFIMIPVLHIKDEKNARRIYVLRNTDKQEAVVKFAQ